MLVKATTYARITGERDKTSHAAASAETAARLAQQNMGATCAFGESATGLVVSEVFEIDDGRRCSRHIVTWLRSGHLGPCAQPRSAWHLCELRLCNQSSTGGVLLDRSTRQTRTSTMPTAFPLSSRQPNLVKRPTDRQLGKTHNELQTLLMQGMHQSSFYACASNYRNRFGGYAVA